MLRRDLDQHLKNNCPNRQHQCPNCKASGRHCDITTTHLYTCPKVNIPCPNDGCKALVPHCELADHRSKCQFEKVSCKYAGIGCKEELLRKDLEQHELDDTFHLHTAIETVNKQQSEINKQREEINEQRDEINEQREEINKQEKEINKQRVEINKQQKELKAVKAKQKIMSDSILAAQAGPCIFKMIEFSRYKSSNKNWFSPAFYTSPGGYKMCVRVDANGFGEGAGTHVSVFACLMQGRNDDNLPWPFIGKVTFTLLNQLEDKNHHTRTISFEQDNEAGRKVVDGELAAMGFGQYTFISHNKLYAPWNCQYLKEDCLYFRVKVQATTSWLTCTV